MKYSRLARFEESRQVRRMYGAIAGIIAIFLFVAFFGLKILIGFSLLVDKIRGTSHEQISQQVILPPELDPLPVATNSATISVSGRGESGMTVIVYINETDTEKTTVDKDGNFRIEKIKLIEGINSISSKQMDEKKNMSNLSDVASITYTKSKPFLELTSPSDQANIRGENNTVTVSGKTNDDLNSVTVNDRLVIVRGDGTFSYDYALPDGDTVLKITVTDPAGNKTSIESRVTIRNSSDTFFHCRGHDPHPEKNEWIKHTVHKQRMYGYRNEACHVHK